MRRSGTQASAGRGSDLLGTVCGRAKIASSVRPRQLGHIRSLPPAPRRSPMIQLSGLTKAFGDRVLLDAVSWQIDDRERVGLAGPNGAGKTTLLKMLAGLDEP